jgi:hypothetical protein
VAENNVKALNFYRTRSFHKLDAAIFLAKKVESEEELLPPRPLKKGKLAPKSKPIRRRSERPPPQAADTDTEDGDGER